MKPSANSMMFMLGLIPFQVFEPNGVFYEVLQIIETYEKTITEG